MVMPPDMGELVARAKEGDRLAFEGLVRASHADMYTLAYRLTGNEEDAHDVVQEAYLRAYRSIRRFRGDAQFSTWMHRTRRRLRERLFPIGEHRDPEEQARAV